MSSHMDEKETFTEINLDLLNRLTTQINNWELDFPQVVKGILSILLDYSDADFVLFFQRKGDNLENKGIVSRNGEVLYGQADLHKVKECLCGLAVFHNKPVYSIDIEHDERCTWQECKLAGIHSYAAIPLAVNNDVIGVLGLASYERRDFEKFSTFLEILTNHMAMGLKNNLLYNDIRSSLDHKEILLQELNHRVKNNLAIVSGLLSLHQEQIKDLGVKETINSSINRIHSMGLIHEKLFERSDFTNIDFYEYISLLANHLIERMNIHGCEVTLAIEMKKINISIEQAVPCGLLLNELISNSLKHGFKGRPRGIISISVSQEKENLVGKIHYHDNGIGFSRTTGISKGIGCRLIQELANQLDLSIKKTNSPGNGCSYEFWKLSNPHENKMDKKMKTVENPSSHDKRSAYIVEDEVIIAMALENTLKTFGFSVLGTSSSGKDAIKNIQSSQAKPDIIIMDVGLKGDMDGIETAQRLNEHAMIPIIFRTGYGNDSMMKRMTNSGLPRFQIISKNAGQIELEESILSLL